MLTAHDSHASPDFPSTAAAAEPDCIGIRPSRGFAVDSEFDPPRVTLVVKGELDLAGAPSLERAIEALPWPRLGELTFDLAEVTFIDSAGLAVLIRASQRAATDGLRFSVVRIPSQARKLFKIAGVIDALNAQP